MPADLAVQDDNINQPRHYTSHPSGVECWQVIKSTPKEIADVIKYLWRKDLKNGREDILKSVWYLHKQAYLTYKVISSHKEYGVNLAYALIALDEERKMSREYKTWVDDPTLIGLTVLGQALELLICGLEGNGVTEFITRAFRLAERVTKELEETEAPENVRVPLIYEEQI